MEACRYDELSGLFSRIATTLAKRGQEPRALFQCLDVNRDGRLSRQELFPLLIQLQPDLSDFEMNLLYETVDSNGDGLVGLDEFCRALADSRTENCRPGDDPDACRAGAPANTELLDSLLVRLAAGLARYDLTPGALLSRLDLYGHRSLGCAEFERFLSKFVRGATCTEARLLFTKLDRAQCGQVGLRELCEALEGASVDGVLARMAASVARAGLQPEDLFRALDRRGHGRLSCEDLEAALYQFLPSMTPSHARLVFASIGVDATGWVEPGEFAQALRRARGTCSSEGAPPPGQPSLRHPQLGYPGRPPPPPSPARARVAEQGHPRLPASPAQPPAPSCAAQDDTSQNARRGVTENPARSMEKYHRGNSLLGLSGVDQLMVQQSVKNAEPPAAALLGDALSETAAALVGGRGSLTTARAREDSHQASLLLQSCAPWKNSDAPGAILPQSGGSGAWGSGNKQAGADAGVIKVAAGGARRSQSAGRGRGGDERRGSRAAGDAAAAEADTRRPSGVRDRARSEAGAAQRPAIAFVGGGGGRAGGGLEDTVWAAPAAHHVALERSGAASRRDSAIARELQDQEDPCAAENTLLRQPAVHRGDSDLARRLQAEEDSALALELQALESGAARVGAPESAGAGARHPQDPAPRPRLHDTGAVLANELVAGGHLLANGALRGAVAAKPHRGYDCDAMVRAIYASEGLDLDAARERARWFLEGLGLAVVDAGSVNTAGTRLLRNQCFYLALARSYLGPSPMLQVESTALLFKRQIEGAVLYEHPDWAELGHVGDDVRAFSDFLTYPMRDQNAQLSTFAVVVVDSVSGWIEIYKGVKHDAVAESPGGARQAANLLLLLWRVPQHYQCLAVDDLQHSRPGLTLQQIKAFLDRGGIAYTETCG